MIGFCFFVFSLSELEKRYATSFWSPWFQRSDLLCLNCFPTVGNASFLSGCFPKFFWVFDFSKFNYEMSWNGFIWGSSILRYDQLLEFVDVRFSPNLENVSHFFERSLPTTLWSLSLDSDECWNFLLSHRSLRLLFFSCSLFSFFCSYWVNSIDLSSV